jgi:hypothetical protein
VLVSTHPFGLCLDSVGQLVLVLCNGLDRTTGSRTPCILVFGILVGPGLHLSVGHTEFDFSGPKLSA